MNGNAWVPGGVAPPRRALAQQSARTDRADMRLARRVARPPTESRDLAPPDANAGPRARVTSLYHTYLDGYCYHNGF